MSPVAHNKKKNMMLLYLKQHKDFGHFGGIALWFIYFCDCLYGRIHCKTMSGIDWDCDNYESIIHMNKAEGISLIEENIFTQEEEGIMEQAILFAYFVSNTVPFFYDQTSPNCFIGDARRGCLNGEHPGG